MCRNCSLPEWGEPVKVPVKALPQFFAKQISWNFERLNFGVGAIIETESGRTERPSVTGRVGCKLKEGIQPKSRGRRSERYLLVSECLYCPGKRYNCTPRANCTGKRRNCYAMCKVSVYADAPEVAEVSFSGSHGRGNVTDPTRHRKRAIEDEEQDGGDLVQKWKSSYRPTMVESLCPGELQFDSSSASVASLDAGHSITVTCGDIELVSTENVAAPRGSRSPWSTSASGDPDRVDGNDWASTNGTATSNPVTPGNTPLNTPLASSATSPLHLVQNGPRGSQSRLAVTCTPLRGYAGSRSSLGHTSSWKTESKSAGSRSSTVQEKEQEILTLRQHIQILQEEHLSKISRIAELEAELHLLKEGELNRLEKYIQSLETENLKKDVKILQLEKQLQTTLFSKSQSVAQAQVQRARDEIVSNSQDSQENSEEACGKDKGNEEIREARQAEEKEMDEGDDMEGV